MGLKHRVVKKLIASGMLQRDSSTVLDGRGNESYSKAEVVRLVEKVLAVVMPMNGVAASRRLCPLSKAFQVYSCNELSSAEILGAITRQRISAFMDGENRKLGDLLVDLDDLHGYVIKRLRSNKGGFFDIKEAGKSYGVSEPVIERLVRLGKVRHQVKKFGSRRYVMIDKKSLRSAIDAKITSRKSTHNRS